NTKVPSIMNKLKSAISMQYYNFFLFERSADHQDLHSFPTRRSSDLSCERGRVGDPRHITGRPDGDHDARKGHRDHELVPLDQPRSEEHTSELPVTVKSRMPSSA